MVSSYKIQARERGGLWVTVDILFCAEIAWEVLHKYLIERPDFYSIRLKHGDIVMFMEGNSND